ncbi:hypothetical protein FNV43_RR12376 [Rhamnella rubrinervis]|uniref:Uncharacterized protein n=1 Tax=Rhamnella rubrinervis TaxID=2594499 RepID=A0A8K0H784_9ROSA|nr:hypothetical protein FNV43_RR12376 [Rhamnella rubrinervis]
MEKRRRASHDGSWYTDHLEKIKEALEGRLRASGLTKSPDVRGVIAPSRVFLLGPSDHHYTPKWALSIASVYKTPIGDLPVDLEVIEELKATGKFEMMDIRVDEAERSMEMHLLYLAKVLRVKFVPILVGALNAEATYRQLLAKYLDDPNNFFSVLSDFCHGGARFNYMLYNKKCGSIYKSLEGLDRMGMDIIGTGDLDAFKQYLLEYENTIYGRHPISGFGHKHGAVYKYIEALDRMGMDKVETDDPDAFKQYLLEYENTFYGRIQSAVFSMLGLNFCLFLSVGYYIFVFLPLILELAGSSQPPFPQERGQGIPLLPRPGRSESASMAGCHSSTEELAAAALPSSSSMASRRSSMEELAFARGRLYELPAKRNADEEPPSRRRDLIQIAPKSPH